MPKENSLYKCLSLTMLDSVIKASKKYYPQTFMEECKYEAKKTKMENLNLIMHLTINNLMKLNTVF